jgi:hypothetical protein
LFCALATKSTGKYKITGKAENIQEVPPYVENTLCWQLEKWSAQILHSREAMKEIAKVKK